MNITSDGAELTCDGRLTQKLALETEKACLPTVEIEWRCCKLVDQSL